MTTQVAVIVVMPTETLLARPAALIVATPGADEPHWTEAVRFWVLPPLKRPVAVNCCVFPAAIEGFAGVTVMDMSPLVLSAPLRGITLGLPETREGRVRMPGRTSAKSSVGAMPETVPATIFWLVSVTDGVALVLPTAKPPKFQLLGVSSTGAMPVPVNEMIGGLVAASSVTVSVAVRIPSAEGVKVTVMRQFSPGPSVLGERGQFPPAT
jgi:hypothetical protein